LIIDPWGEILADGGSEPGVIYADIDLDQVQKVRSRIPSLKNERPFTLEQQ
jgi:predicted amidohydrolase